MTEQRATWSWSGLVLSGLVAAYFAISERRFVAKGIIEAIVAIAFCLVLARQMDALSEIIRRSPRSVMRKELWEVQAVYFALTLLEFAFVVASFVALRFVADIIPESNLVVRLIRVISLDNPLLMVMVLIGSLGLYGTAAVSLASRLVPDFPEEQERIVVRG